MEEAVGGKKSEAAGRVEAVVMNLKKLFRNFFHII